MKVACLGNSIYSNSLLHRQRQRELNNQRPHSDRSRLDSYQGLERKVQWVQALNRRFTELKLLQSQQLEDLHTVLHLEEALSLEQHQRLEEALLQVDLEEAHPRQGVLEVEQEASSLDKPLHLEDQEVHLLVEVQLEAYLEQQPQLLQMIPITSQLT